MEPITELHFVRDSWLISLRQSGEVSLWQWPGQSLINRFQPSVTGDLRSTEVDGSTLITVDKRGTINRYQLF
ncbi:hypothetical protein [Shewanella ulleungensis]|uniref:hypothetical protein n=1 Tax=Shewanella ulleungensis TaxID=2282699 RepID=UPI00166DB3F4|nr:hypothetical protein [Shewanella ulleungensis]MCL1148896.1 hypothetical protein [Shewanella ulleungensis]